MSSYKRSYDARPTTVLKSKLRSLYKAYGLSGEEYSLMMDNQKGCCKLCEDSLEVPNVDHCHTTGEVRGLLCNPCNQALGLIKDKISTLENMIEYLK